MWLTPGVLHRYIHIQFVDGGVAEQKLVVRLSKFVTESYEWKSIENSRKMFNLSTEFCYYIVLNENWPDYLTKTDRNSMV